MDDPRKILSMSVGEMPGYGFDCPCGKHHSIDLNRIITGSGVLSKLPAELEKFKDKKIMIVADPNTVKIGGNKVKELLDGSGYDTELLVLDTPDYPILLPDERTVGALLIHTSPEVGLIIGVGSGTINDLCKFVSFKMKLPFVIVGTAPSMDGYASFMAPLIVDRQKITYPAQYPYIIVTDTDLLNTAPLIMKKAGYGDVIGKFTALADWRLAHKVKGDHYCDITAELVQNAVDECVANQDAYFRGEPEAVLKMNDTLLLTGVSIGLIGYTRPASGSEHHLSHYWELDGIARGVEHPLHGNSVGLGSIASAEVYKIMRKRFEVVDSVNPPDPDMLREIYARAGMALKPMDLGIDRDLFNRSLNNGYRIRPRYTIFNFTKEQGMLPEVADMVTEIMCGGSN
ncbi:MAG: sn-glycerol-1-phosphate dehydrogenase [Clostridia bacterium]|nr:sn-glycerol-1-phosphate dehydrogenase [Clostridia bacterium]